MERIALAYTGRAILPEAYRNLPERGVLELRVPRNALEESLHALEETGFCALLAPCPQAADVLVHVEAYKGKQGPCYDAARKAMYLGVARAALDRVSTLAPVAWKAEVVATAKRDLRPGDQIDGIGGSTVYGVADAAEAVASGGLLPLGLAARATVVRDVAIDQPLTFEDVELDESSTILQLRRLQDRLLGS